MTTKAVQRSLPRQRANEPFPRRATRRGVASVLAMLYLVLFSTLAVGFAAASTMSAQIAGNERLLHQGQIAADGGMQFIRYQLGAITVPSGTTQTNLLDAVAQQLGAQMDTTPNMNSHLVANTNGTIYIPSASDWMMIDRNSGAGFRVAITQSNMNLVVNVTGCGNANTPNTAIHKTIQVQYQAVQKTNPIFNYGIVTKGAMTMSNTVTISGARPDVVIATSSSTPLNNTAPSTSFGGDLYYTNAAGTNSYSTMTIDGYNKTQAGFAQHVHSGATPPTFPTIDTSGFLPYATNTYPNTSGGSSQTLINTILNPGNYNFSNATTIKGVLYIKTPNNISFSGPVALQGCIVVENNPVGTSATNSLKFTQTVNATGIDTLPATAQFPAGERALTGSVILAPNFSVTGTNTFGVVSGSLVAGKFTFTNNFTATVYGSILQLDDTPMTFTNTANISLPLLPIGYNPAGLSAGTYYSPQGGSYVELTN